MMCSNNSYIRKAFFVLAFYAVCVFPFPANAQDARTLLREDPSRAGGNLHHYEVIGPIINTPAPKGYKPFYVSHFSRHGSRYHGNCDTYERICQVLDTLNALGLLTEEGEKVRNDMRSLYLCHVGMGGELTRKGGAEHEGVATRLYGNYPEIFRQKDRKDVLAVSTTTVRCVQSMGYFLNALKGRAPQLNMSMYSSGRENFKLRDEHGEKHPRKAETNAVRDSILRADLDVTRLMEAFFKDPERASGYFYTCDEKFIHDIYYEGIIAQCLDIEDPWIYKYFTEEEIYQLWRYDNMDLYNESALTVENGGHRAITVKYILADIFEKADEAVSPGSRKAADLRFSHDSCIVPLAGFLEFEGNGQYGNMTGCEDRWLGFKEMCMCSNLQIIFFRNHRGDVLVKVLYNEQEKTIPALVPFSGPYYRWSDFREYFSNKMSEI